MRKPLLLSILFSQATLLYSQSESVLQDFKFRNANYRAIQIGVNGSGLFDNTNYSNGKVDQYAVGFTGSFQFQQSRSTEKQLLNLNAGLSPSFSYNNADNVTDNTKARSLSVSPSFYLNNKWFAKKMFTEVGVEALGNFARAKNSYDIPLVVQKTKESFGTLAFTLGIGKGRLENVTDMQNALWLSKSLAEAGRFSHVLTSTELNELGRTITKANNTRVLDARKRTQFILETIDSYFQQNGLINQTDIKYFSNLNDVVFFAFNDQRLSGTEKFIRLRPLIEKYKLTYEEQPQNIKAENKAFNYAGLLTIGINKHVPKNLKHQNDFGISAELKYQSNDYNEYYSTPGSPVNSLDIESTLKQGGLAGFFEHGIYPNSRTLINFRAEARGGYQDLEGDESHYISTQLLANWNYFISYRTRITCGITALYQDNMYSTSSSYYYLHLLPETVRVFANVGLEVNL